MAGHGFAVLPGGVVFGGYFFHCQDQRPRVAGRRFGFQQQQVPSGPGRGESLAVSSLAQSGDFRTTAMNSMAEEVEVAAE